MGLQQENQMELNMQGQQIQQDMWDYTNYGNQIKHMEKAGLNPALMYGMSGGGGTTAGSQGGGSAQGGSAVGGNAPRRPENSLMGLQIEMAKQDVEGKKIDNAIKRGDDPANRGKSEIEAIMNRAKLDLENAKNMEIKNEIDKKTKQDRITEIKEKAIGEEIRNREMESKIKLNNEQKEVIRDKVNQQWVKIGIKSLEGIATLVEKYVPFK
jgi:hypothetical protein